MVAIACKNIVFSDIKAIIFDKDGTLEDSQAFWLKVGIERASLIEEQIPGIKESLLKAFGIQNGQLNPEGLMAVGSRRDNEIVAAGYIAHRGISWFEAQKIARQAFIAAEQRTDKTSELSPLFPHSLTTLQSLAKNGLKLGILSADSTLGVQTFVAHHNLKDYIQLNMGSDGMFSKPDPKLFLQACQALEVAPANTLMVGDSVGDIEMAKTAGAKGTIGICPNSRSSYLDRANVQIGSISEIQILQS
ncbi:MAG: HAD family hydrolase [Pleurocapsa sp.]